MLKSVNIVHAVALILLIISRFIDYSFWGYVLFATGVNYTYGGFLPERDYCEWRRWQFWVYIVGVMFLLSWLTRTAYILQGPSL